MHLLNESPIDSFIQVSNSCIGKSHFRFFPYSHPCPSLVKHSRMKPYPFFFSSFPIEQHISILFQSFILNKSWKSFEKSDKLESIIECEIKKKKREVYWRVQDHGHDSSWQYKMIREVRFPDSPFFRELQKKKSLFTVVWPMKLQKLK